MFLVCWFNCVYSLSTNPWGIVMCVSFLFIHSAHADAKGIMQLIRQVGKTNLVFTPFLFPCLPCFLHRLPPSPSIPSLSLPSPLPSSVRASQRHAGSRRGRQNGLPEAENHAGVWGQLLHAGQWRDCYHSNNSFHPRGRVATVVQANPGAMLR